MLLVASAVAVVRVCGVVFAFVFNVDLLSFVLAVVGRCECLCLMLLACV